MYIRAKIIEELNKYYRRNGELTMVGINGSQGVNLTPFFLKKGLLELLAKDIGKDLSPTIINAFSLTMNKTEHIDYFLDANLSLKEIKLSQIYSAVSAIEKVVVPRHFPAVLSKIGYLSHLVYKEKREDANVHIKDMIQNSIEPVIIYASGENNLMREVGSNPFAIIGDYKKRNKKPNYDYTKEKVKDKKTLSIVLQGVERNFNHILSINNKADIYTLGTYIPKSLKVEELKDIKDFILSYNEKLRKLCQEYGCFYIQAEEIGNKYLIGKRNFHANIKGHNYLENMILLAMYEKKIINPSSKIVSTMYNPEYTLGNGANYVFASCMNDLKKCLEEVKDLKEYAYKRKLDIAEEHIREMKIFEKVKRN